MWAKKDEYEVVYWLICIKKGSRPKLPQLVSAALRLQDFAVSIFGYAFGHSLYYTNFVSPFCTQFCFVTYLRCGRKGTECFFATLEILRIFRKLFLQSVLFVNCLHLINHTWREGDSDKVNYIISELVFLLLCLKRL